MLETRCNFFNIISCVLTLFGYLFTIYEYKGNSSNIPNVVSMDSDSVILAFTALSIFFTGIAFWLRRKNKATLYIFYSINSTGFV